MGFGKVPKKKRMGKDKQEKQDIDWF